VSRGGRIRVALATLIGATALFAVAPIGSAGDASIAPRTAGQHKCNSSEVVRVRIGDDFFAPRRVAVERCTRVRWRWLPGNLHVHDVTLRRAPAKVRKRNFKSGTGSIGLRFSRRLKRPGTYKFVCSVHRTVMKLTIVVSS
jgi:plastocyanin